MTTSIIREKPSSEDPTPYFTITAKSQKITVSIPSRTVEYFKEMCDSYEKNGVFTDNRMASDPSIFLKKSEGSFTYYREGASFDVKLTEKDVSLFISQARNIVKTDGRV